ERALPRGASGGVARPEPRIGLTSPLRRDGMMYDERFVAPMRAEITQYGVEELKTAAAVDEALTQRKGTQLLIVNSICGCAARNMRPAVGMALQHAVTPDHKFTVFAGNDADA